MSGKKGYFDTDNRQLTDVFRELQQTRLQYEALNSKKFRNNTENITTNTSDVSNNVSFGKNEKKDAKSKISETNFDKSTNSGNTYKVYSAKSKNDKKQYKSSRKTFNIFLVFILLLIAVAVALLGSNTISATDSSIELYSPLSEIGKETVSIEINRHRLNAHNIITSNAALETVKEQVVEERDIEFESLYTERATLPKDEEVILQQGVNGKKNVTLVRSYNNGELTEETILNEEKTKDYLPQIVDRGTSEFLAKIKAHLKDTLYLTKSDKLYKDKSTTSEELAEIQNYWDVVLLDLPSEDWCKVSYEGIEGYISTKNLTTAAVTPNIPEKNRIQKLVVKLDKNMPLNQSSGLTLADYKKIFTGLSNDKNKIFEDNYEVFYNIDKKYNINGIFLASLGIHESAWGTSQIANDKKNLFGYGSYDSTPYQSSYEFEDYKDGIELVAKVMVKYYINPIGTKIYDGEKALATYYNGPTIADVNKRYASDENWHEKVYSYMEMLYKRLEK